MLGARIFYSRWIWKTQMWPVNIGSVYLRSKTLERFGLALMHDPLWDYAANLKGADAAFDEAVKIKNYRGYGAKIGHPRDMQTISQKTLRFRAIAMIKAHLPSGIDWFTEISTLPDDQSVYSWYAHKQRSYLFGCR